MAKNQEDYFLLKFPKRKGPTRFVYFDALSEEHERELTYRGYTPVLLVTLPRETERDHKMYLLAVSQGMAEGTIMASKDRLAAVDLDMRAHGMLSRYSTGIQDDNKRRRSVEEVLESWDTGRHAVHQSTIIDPREVEKILREKAGILSIQPKEEKKKIKKRWKRITKGQSED